MTASLPTPNLRCDGSTTVPQDEASRPPATLPAPPAVSSAAQLLHAQAPEPLLLARPDLLHALARRLAMPLILAGAMLVVLVNERAYQTTFSALHAGHLQNTGPAAPADQEVRASQRMIDRALLIHRHAVTALTLLAALGLGLYTRRWLGFEADRSRLEADLRRLVGERTEELSKLAGHLVAAREDEKAHLARELHDELGALLTAAKFDVARMRGPLHESPALLHRLDQLDKRLNEGISLKRRIVEDLRPSSLSTLGLGVSLQNLCADVGSSLGLVIATDLEAVNLSEEGQLAVYRMVQEALTNVAKYAAAKQVRVRVRRQPGGIVVSVEDDGRGFDTGVHLNSGHGLAGMRFRVEQLNGQFSVTSILGQGARLCAVLPAGG